jgi:hypothetical protein
MGRKDGDIQLNKYSSQSPSFKTTPSAIKKWPLLR